VWYGRATPSDVGLIVRLSLLCPLPGPSLARRTSLLTYRVPRLLQVDRTIMQGKVVPELLRGGMGLEGKDGERGVLDW